VPRIVLDHLTKTYVGPNGRAIHALADFNLTVEDKELLVIVGPSGCGKTTALRLVAGLDQSFSGQISIDGNPMNGIAAKDRDIAMVFQNPALYPHLTVRENLAFGLKIRKCARLEIEQRVGATAEMLGLRDCLDRPPGELSGGQCQRVAVGRAIVRHPKILLFDEPLSNLDIRTRVQMRGEISRLHRAISTTIVYVTHDQGEALAIGDRVGVMRGGTILQVSGPMEIYRRPENIFVAEFIGSPPMNLIRGDLCNPGDALVFRPETGTTVAARFSQGLALGPGSAPALANFVGKQVIIGIRPEQLSIVAPENGSLTGPAGSERGQGQIDGLVDFIERAGPDSYAHLTWGGQRLVARAEPAIDLIPRQGVSLRLAADKAIFFDPATGTAIR
jgi:multiple sugar transport system ATP-binding protein